MVSFFRRKEEFLPTTSSSSRSAFSFRSNPKDGSARNIRLGKPLSKAWSQTNIATRATYICLLFFIILFWLGLRWMRWSNAHIHLNCRLLDCDIEIVPLGWGRKIAMNFPRRQLIDSYSVKTDAKGNFVEGRVSLNDDNVGRPISKKKKHSGKKQNYKGPDANGHYVSYALILTDVEPVTGEENAEVSANEQQLKTLDSLKEYLDPIEDGQYRLVLRKFRMGQSKRRVRTILSKIDGYIKRRRTQLIVKENSPPAWQGILGIVLGLMGFLLTLLIGQLWDELPPTAAGPGARRETRSEALRRTMPARYEVATTSHRPSHLTTASKRAAVRSTASKTNKHLEAWR